jgi:hypothetical protein
MKLSNNELNTELAQEELTATMPDIAAVMATFLIPNDFEGDYKDMAVLKASHLYDVLGFEAVEAMDMPDAYSCPRSFSKWLCEQY